MTAKALFDAHKKAGLDVHVYGDWANRGGTWATGKPSGIMQHHTAPPVPFPVHRLVGSRLKANVNTKPDGQVWLLAYGACNYSSGPGSSVVLRKNVNLKTPPTQNALQRGLKDDFNGNPWYWNYENDHPGDGSPLPKVQFEAIVESTRIVAEHFQLDPATQTISHAEHTRRKSDPYWDADRRCIETIRQALKETDMPLTQADADLVVGTLMNWQMRHGINFWLQQSRIYDHASELVLALRAGENVSDDELEAQIDRLADILGQLPEEVMTALWRRLAPGPA